MWLTIHELLDFIREVLPGVQFEIVLVVLLQCLDEFDNTLERGQIIVVLALKQIFLPEVPDIRQIRAEEFRGVRPCNLILLELEHRVDRAREESVSTIWGAISRGLLEHHGYHLAEIDDAVQLPFGCLELVNLGELMARRLDFFVYEPALRDVQVPRLHEPTELVNVVTYESILLDLLRMHGILVADLVWRVADSYIPEQDLVEVFRDAVLNTL